jgi:hypothetical protein
VQTVTGFTNNGTKGHIIINAGTLHEPTKNPSSLVYFECPIGFELVLKDLLTGDNIGAVGCSTKSQVSLDIREAHSSSIDAH